MKPFVIYAEKNSIDVTMTKAEFEEYIKKAYEGGYEDGYKVGQASASIKWDWPTIVTTNDPSKITPYYTTTPYTPPDYTKITCEAHNAVE